MSRAITDQAEMLLARAYRTMSRESWQDGETIDEVRAAINDFMFNKHQTAKWDELFPRREIVAYSEEEE
jgi:hypothetical protein